jgi:hypothetical protein
MEAAPNGMPLIAGVAKVKKHFKLKKSPAVPPISTLQAPPAAGAPEKKAEAPKGTKSVRNMTPDEDLTVSILDTPWLYTRGLKVNEQDPTQYLEFARDLLLDAVSNTAMYIGVGKLETLSDFLITNVKVKNVIHDWSKYDASYNKGYKEVAKTIMRHQKKYFHEGGWSQTSPVLGEGPGVFSSVQVSFAEENKVGGRIGIRWHPTSGEEDAGWKRDAAGKPWWGEIKLTLDYDVKTKEFEWAAHVRCEWDRADDWETSQKVIDVYMKHLTKRDSDAWSPKYYAPYAAKAVENVDLFLKKRQDEKMSKEQAIKEIKSVIEAERKSKL